MTNQAIYYRHYDMCDRVTQSAAHHWFWDVVPMTTAAPVITAVMDDFGMPQKVNFANLGASLANSDH
jgi:hypothetical protein